MMIMMIIMVMMIWHAVAQELQALCQLCGVEIQPIVLNTVVSFIQRGNLVVDSSKDLATTPRWSPSHGNLVHAPGHADRQEEWPLNLATVDQTTLNQPCAQTLV